MLDEDKSKLLTGGYYRIDSPGDRYKGLHRETFGQQESDRGTVATFVKPLIVRNVLFGLFCVDIAAASPPGSQTNQLDDFTGGLASLGKGIEATLGACSKAYYTHLDHSLIEPDLGVTDEPPILSAAFLETMISEIQGRQVSDLAMRPIGYFFFDNNDLKQVNTFGNYECGSEVIRATGRWIAKGVQRWASTYKDPGSGSVRDRLEACPRSWVVRWGGDEFVAVVVGGKGDPRQWDKLLQSIEDQIVSEREAFSKAILTLPSLERKTAEEKKRLADVVSRTSVSVGGVYVPRIDTLSDEAIGEQPAAFLRLGRVQAEDRMKLVKSLAKMDQGQVQLLLRKGDARELKLQPFGRGLCSCYGEFLAQSATDATKKVTLDNSSESF